MGDLFDEEVPLNWPARGYEFTDDQIEHDHISQMLRQGCEEACNELELDAANVDISNGIAAKFLAAGLMAHLPPKSLTAVGIFMASHMTCCSRSAMRVIEVVGMSGSAFRSAYEIAYANLDVLIDERALEDVGSEGMERILGRLPIL